MRSDSISIHCLRRSEGRHSISDWFYSVAHQSFHSFHDEQVHSARIRARNARASISAVSCAPSESANFLINDRSSDRSSFSNKFCGLLGETCVFICHSSLSYAIMLSVMLYSGWLFVAAVVGMGLGYFLFGHISVRINMESAQARTTTIVCSTACPENAENGSVQGNNQRWQGFPMSDNNNKICIGFSN